MTLEEKFLGFLQTYEGTESLDDPRVWPDTATGQKADFLVRDRRAIVEVKTLESDPAYKLEKIANRWRLKLRTQFLFGNPGIDALLTIAQSDEQLAIHQEVADCLSDQIERAIESANRQIRNTRAVLKLPDARGYVFLMNDQVATMDPQLVRDRLRMTLSKRRTAGGAWRFPEIAWVGLISEAHTQEIGAVTVTAALASGGPATEGQPKKRDAEFDAILTVWGELQSKPFVEFQWAEERR